MFNEVDFGMGNRTAPQGTRVVPSATARAEPYVRAPMDDSSVVDLTELPTETPTLIDLLRRYFNISAQTYDEDPTCRLALRQAASECLMYGFFPGRHVRVRQIAGEWTCEEGYRAWLDAANKMAAQQRFAFDIEVVPMTSEEVRRLMPVGEYTPGDLGYFARVLRSDILRMYKDMGKEYDPEWHPGFWKHKGYREVDAYGNLTADWHPDPIWTGRDAAYTAKVRASKAALMAGFSLIELDAHDMDTRLRRLTTGLEGELEEREREDPRAKMLLIRPEPRREVDGDTLWA